MWGHHASLENNRGSEEVGDKAWLHFEQQCAEGDIQTGGERELTGG